MTVILPEDHHAIDALEAQRISCMTASQAAKQDIRALRIGILNIMPNLETYEYNLLSPLGHSLLQVEPVWIKLKSHTYGSSNKEHLEKLYLTFEEAIQGGLDGLIVTGAPVGKLPFEEIRYWDEISEIFAYARKHIVNTLGICWGGIALAQDLGLTRTFYSPKLFGVFKGTNLNRSHPITGDLDDTFDCPQSRYSRFEDALMEEKAQAGVINLLAHEKDAGYFLFESSDSKFVMHLGHPEYNSGRLVEEAQRDAEAGLDDVAPPVNFNTEHPINTWRCHRNEFFQSWIKYLYLKNEY